MGSTGCAAAAWPASGGIAHGNGPPDDSDTHGLGIERTSRGIGGLPPSGARRDVIEKEACMPRTARLPMRYKTPMAPSVATKRASRRRSSWCRRTCPKRLRADPAERDRNPENLAPFAVNDPWQTGAATLTQASIPTYRD
jgi:hypothetical protein